MHISYALSKDDFFTYQLYWTSTSPLANRNRKKGTFLVPLILILLGFLSILLQEYGIAAWMMGVGIVWFFLFPPLFKWKMEKDLSQLVKEHYQNRFDKLQSLSFGAKYISLESKVGESQINLSEIKELIEIETHFFLKLSNGSCLILPKAKLKDLAEVKSQLEEIVLTQEIPYKRELDWKW